MKLTVNSGKTYDYGDWDELQIDGRDVHSSRALCECPEDAILGRSLTAASEIAGWIKDAFELGKNGGELTIECTQEKD